MRFILVDRIVAYEPGRRIVAQKALSLAEEYLADHFPAFPVLPGVLMLEALTQAAAWLVRHTLDFAPGLVVLQEARNVTFKSFLTPGQLLTLEAVCQECNAEHSLFSAAGRLDDREVVKARLRLRHLNLADVDPALATVDEQNRQANRALFARLQAARSDGLTARNN